jgi:hypothetical protein
VVTKATWVLWVSRENPVEKDLEDSRALQLRKVTRESLEYQSRVVLVYRVLRVKKERRVFQVHQGKKVRLVIRD